MKMISQEPTDEEKYDYFICYFSAGATHFAEHLWKNQSRIGCKIFLDSKNLPKRMNGGEDEWSKHRDSALINSKYMIFIMTIGYNKSEEIKNELKISWKKGIEVYYYKHNSLTSSDLHIEIDGINYDLNKKQWIPFKNEFDLFNNVANNHKIGMNQFSKNYHKMFVNEFGVSKIDNYFELILDEVVNDTEKYISKNIAPIGFIPQLEIIFGPNNNPLDWFEINDINRWIVGEFSSARARKNLRRRLYKLY